MAESFNTNLKEIASEYAQLLNIKVTSSSIKKDIEENPYYPSLLSLSDTFDHYHIDNDAYEVAPTKLNQFVPPFLAFASVQDGTKDFVLVKSINEREVTFLYKNKVTQTVLKEEFYKQYQHVIWAANPDERSGEQNFDKKRKAEKVLKNRMSAWRTAVIILIVLILAGNFETAFALSFISLLLIKFVGLATTVLLLIYDMDKNNVFVKDICSAGKNLNCDAVLNSKASKFNGITWSEIGFFYFASTTLLLVLPFVPFYSKIAMIAVLNTLATPYIFFSLYYQWRFVKQWCPLCLSVQAAIFSEMIWSIFTFWTANISLSSAFSQILTFGFCILLPIVSWYGLKQMFASAKDAKLYSSAYKRLQYNPEIFNSLLVQQKKLHDGWQHQGIDIGNSNAEHIIVKICNPYCGPCARAHAELEEMIKHSCDLKLKIIFITKNNDNGRSAAVVRHLLTIAAKGNAVETQRCLDHWYLAENKSYEEFSQLYPVGGELKQQESKIEAMNKWCEDAEIMFTPTIFVNGYRLPENYNLGLLKHIL